MTLHISSSVRSHLWQIVAPVVVILCSSTVTVFGVSQNGDSPQDKGLAEAIRLLDSPDEEDREKIEKMVRTYLTGNPQSAEAYCVLALLCFDQDRIDEATSVIEKIQKQKIPLNATMKGMIGQIRLCCAISSSEREESEKLFKAMVNAVQREATATEDKKSYCQTLGTIVAVLESVPDESPINSELLATGHAAMKSLSAKSLSFHYEESYQAAAKRVAEIDRWYETFSSMSPTERDREVKRLQSELDSLQEPLAIAIETAQVAARNQKEIAKQSVKDFRELNGQRAVAVNNLNTPLPGHPGNEPVAPKVPNRNDIQVNEFQTVERRDSKGNITRDRERRPQSDIDNERDRKYQGALSNYNILKSNYDKDINIYRQTLKTWLAEEERRKKTINEEISKIDEKRKELEEEVADALSDKKTSSQDLVNLRTEIKDKRLTFQCASLAAAAANSGKKFSAMQPHHFNAITIASEKQRLLNATR